MIIAILLILLFNIISPTISQADFGGKLFKPIAQLLSGLCDLVIQGLQNYFIGFGDYYQDGPNGEYTQYYIRYSPGIIFSGEVADLQINFINAEENEKIKKDNINRKYNPIFEKNALIRKYYGRF